MNMPNEPMFGRRCQVFGEKDAVVLKIKKQFRRCPSQGIEKSSLEIILTIAKVLKKSDHHQTGISYRISDDFIADWEVPSRGSSRQPVCTASSTPQGLDHHRPHHKIQRAMDR